MQRQDFPKMFDEMGFKVGAEIGVYEGKFSAHILANSSLSLLHSIDSWCNVEGVSLQSILDTCKTVLAPFGSRSNIIVSSSHEASKQFEDESLDFVYIDADHRYDAVVDDILVWFPKVRKGGILSGHDYTISSAGKGIGAFQTTPNQPCRGKKGVKKAVDEFVDKHGIKLHLTDKGCKSWWIIKE